MARMQVFIVADILLFIYAHSILMSWNSLYPISLLFVSSIDIWNSKCEDANISTLHNTMENIFLLDFVPSLLFSH